MKACEAENAQEGALDTDAHAIAATRAVISLKLDVVSLAHCTLGKRLVGAIKRDLTLDPSLSLHVPGHFHPALRP
jgi:hypothetical protein